MRITTDMTAAEPMLLQDAGRMTQSLGASCFSVDVAKTAADIESLAPDWRALERLSGPNTIFQSHAHIRTWARHFISEARGRNRLHVAVVRERGRAALILPLVVSGSAPLRIARMAGDPISQYSDLLFDPGAGGRPAFEAALASVAKARIDVVILRRVRADSELKRLAGDHLRLTNGEIAAPYADLSAYPSSEAFLQSLSKKTRQGLRNRRNHLAKAGDVSFTLMSGGPEARRALADAINLKRRWLVQRGALSAAFLDPGTRNCLLDLAEHETGAGAVVLRLLVKGEPAAIGFGFEHMGTHFNYLSAYDESFAQLSPGKMLIDFYVSEAKPRGMSRLDMLPPSGRHKTEWCHNETAVADYTLPLTRAGRFYAATYLERLRPALQRTWHRFPEGIRSKAATWFINI